MKKVYIYVLAIILCATLAIFVSFKFINKATDLRISSSDDTVEIDFGKEKVSDVTEGGMNGLNYFLWFNESEDLNFYDDMIKTSDYYYSDLDYDIESFTHYGFLVKEDHVFKYEIKSSYITLESVSGSFSDDGDYIINAPISNDITPDSLDINSSEDDTSYYYEINSCLSDDNISFKMLTDIMGHLDNKYYEIKNGDLYLKGEDQLNNKELSDNYLIKISDNNGKIVVSIAN